MGMMGEYGTNDFKDKFIKTMLDVFKFVICICKRSFNHVN